MATDPGTHHRQRKRNLLQQRLRVRPGPRRPAAEHPSRRRRGADAKELVRRLEERLAPLGEAARREAAEGHLVHHCLRLEMISRCVWNEKEEASELGEAQGGWVAGDKRGALKSHQAVQTAETEEDVAARGDGGRGGGRRGDSSLGEGSHQRDPGGHRGGERPNLTQRPRRGPNCRQSCEEPSDGPPCCSERHHLRRWVLRCNHRVALLVPREASRELDRVLQPSDCVNEPRGVRLGARPHPPLRQLLHPFDGHPAG